jgi:hypothetical protein
MSRGQVLGFTTIARDITNSIKAEEALREVKKDTVHLLLILKVLLIDGLLIIIQFLCTEM